MKKMIITALVIIASAITTTMVAQEWSFGVKAGMNVTNISNLDMNAKVGYSAGAIAKYDFNDSFALKGELLFSGQGARESYEGVDNKILLNYINIPVIASYNFIAGLSAGVGIQPGFLIGAKGKVSVDGESAKESIMDECNKFDLSIPLEICYDFNNGIHLGLRYSIGLTNIFKNSIESTRNQVFNITVGYMF